MNEPVILGPIHIEGSLGFGECAVFLDRDGVINEDHGYVGTWDRFEFIHGAIEGIKLLNDIGYRVIIVSNQSGIGRGLYSYAEFVKLTEQMLNELNDLEVNIDAVYACPHLDGQKEVNCDCRKPKPGMILAAISKYNLSAKKSYLVGDKLSDIQAAKAAGISHTALITGSLENITEVNIETEWLVESLYDFSKIIYEDHRLKKPLQHKNYIPED